MKEVNISFRLSSATASEVNYLCKSLDKNISDLMRDALDVYILLVYTSSHKEAIHRRYQANAKLLGKDYE